MTEAQQAATPALDEAVVVAKSRFEEWLKDNLGRDLNGRQCELLARVALEVLYPAVRIAAFRDLAAALRANPEVPDLFADAIDRVADEAHGEEVERVERARD